MTRTAFSGFNSAAKDEELYQLQSWLGHVPNDVLTLYRDHNGSDSLPCLGRSRLAARLMPIAEALKTSEAMQRTDTPGIESTICLWSDHNSNYCCVYTRGPLEGFVAILDHEEPMLAPAFRSIASFMSQLLSDGPKTGQEDQGGGQVAYDIPSLSRCIPELSADLDSFDQDSLLAKLFEQLYSGEQDVRLRRLFAFCSICLTPFGNTADIFPFMDDEDMWIAESAVRLVDVRRYSGAVERLETLAHQGGHNSSMAALNCLCRLNTNESREALRRLQNTLSEPRLRTLQQMVSSTRPLPMPRWP